MIHDVLTDTTGIDVYELKTMLPANAVVQTVFPDTVQYTTHCDSWFFFVDDHPGYRYTHPVRYVFIYVQDGDYEVIHEGFPPDNFDELELINP